MEVLLAAEGENELQYLGVEAVLMR
jgi:hypothetical protein